MKIGKFLVAAFACFFLFAGESSAKSFQDVNMSTELGRAVDYLSERKIISGYSNGTFLPNNNVTRIQAAKIVAGAVNIESNASKKPGYYTPRSFKDLATSHPNFEAVNALREWSAMSGYDDNTFKPNNNLTRAQIAKILSRVYGFPSYIVESAKGKQFKDVKTDSESYAYIRQMYDLKIMSETKKDYFSPNQIVTRGELALYIYRLEQYFAEQAVQMENNASFNAPNSLIAYLYEGEPVMAQQIYMNAPIYAIRKTIDETATFGGVEGGECASFLTFSLCGGYFFLGDSELSSLLIDGNGYTVADLEELIGEDIEVNVFESAPMPYSVRFIYEGFSYVGELDSPSKYEKVKYLMVTPN